MLKGRFDPKFIVQFGNANCDSDVYCNIIYDR